MFKHIEGVFGGLDLHGKPHNVCWTRLAITAESGSKVVTLVEAVDWSVNDDIIIAASGVWAWETEIFKIASVSSDKKEITVFGSLKYRHIGNCFAFP